MCNKSRTLLIVIHLIFAIICSQGYGSIVKLGVSFNAVLAVWYAIGILKNLDSSND